MCACVFQLPRLRGNAGTQGSTCGRLKRAEQQPFVDYLTVVQNLADACEFAEKENMIRDKIVFSICASGEIPEGKVTETG